MKSAGLALTVLGFFTSSLTAEIPPSYDVKLPGEPFGVVDSRDRKWIFVSLLTGQQTGIAVLQNTGGRIQFIRTVPMDRRPSGMVITHSGDTLIAAADDGVVFFDTRKLEAGGNDPAFQWVRDGLRANTTYVNVTADDKTLFVSDENAATITVIDMDRIRPPGRDSGTTSKRADSESGAPDAIVGKIPVGVAPIALTFSKDERWLFTTSQVAPPDWRWPAVLKREVGKGKVPEGAVIVIDVAKARIDPHESVVTRIPAGGSPVRLALSPDGSRLFVSARNSNAVLVFETADLVTNPNNAESVKIPVGTGPVPVVLVKNGRLALVGNSNRFDPSATNSTLTVLDTSRIGTQMGPQIGEIPCGAFPREFHLSADGQTLYLTNFRTGTLQVLDVNRLTEIIKKSGP